MRDFLKSTLRFSWVMSLFGIQQLESAISDASQQTNRTTTAFDSVTGATNEQLSGVVKDAFNAGDRLQSGMVNMIFGALPGQSPPGDSNLTPGAQPTTSAANTTTRPTRSTVVD